MLDVNIISVQLSELLETIDHQIHIVETFAREEGIPPLKLMDRNGNWVMAPLLLAKAQTLTSLAYLGREQQ